MSNTKKATKTKKSNKKTNKKNRNGLFRSILITIISLLLAGLVGVGVNIRIVSEEQQYNATIEFSEEQIPATVEDDKGELITEDDIPTVEEVDGGKFEDATTGLSLVEGEYDDLGWSEWYPTSTPEAFRNSTIGKCIYANNKFGAQCVSLARVFWWSYANRDVSTCGSGMAKGMMNCADQNAGNDFIVYWSDSYKSIQAGDWLIFNGGQYGHVGMALGPVTNGYVALLGENQGGGYCQGGGAATNIINISIKNLIGFYRPKSYIKPEPKPTPTPTPIPHENKCQRREVVKGDTLGKIMKECTGKVEWGGKMNEYASHWYSLKLKKFNTVYDGWTSQGSVGLFAGDVIEYRK